MYLPIWLFFDTHSSVLPSYTLPHLDRTKGYLVIISSGAAQLRIPYASNYCVSKHAVGRFNEFIAMGERHSVVSRRSRYLTFSSTTLHAISFPEHPHVKSFALHPGSIKTDTAMLNPSWESVMIDSPRLPAATALRLTSGRDNYLSGKFVSANWDLDEVEKTYKTEIINQEALVSRLAIPH